MEGQGSGKISSSSSSDDANTIRNASIKTTSKTVATASTTPTTTTTMVTMVGPVTGNTKWDMMYHNLMEYKRKHNNCLVPNRYKQMPQLGSWVSTQRRHYKLKQAGKDTPLTQLRLDLLNRVGFVWATKDPRHVPWEQRFNELLNFKKKHGNCLVPVSYEENPQLANWVSTQRQEWKSYSAKRPSRLTDEKVSLLNNVGFVWEAQRGYRKRQSCEKAADTDKTRYESNEKKSPRILNQEDNHEKNEKTRKASYKKEQDRPWIGMFKEYLWYTDQNLSPEDIPSLKQWADEQRVEYKQQSAKQGKAAAFQEGQSKLTLDQFKLLQSIKFDWKFDSEPVCVEKCPSAESEIAEYEDQGSSKVLNTSPNKNSGTVNSAGGTESMDAKDTEVDVAKTLFSMGSKRSISN